MIWLWGAQSGGTVDCDSAGWDQSVVWARPSHGLHRKCAHRLRQSYGLDQMEHDDADQVQDATTGAGKTKQSAAPKQTRPRPHQSRLPEVIHPEPGPHAANRTHVDQPRRSKRACSATWALRGSPVFSSQNGLAIATLQPLTVSAPSLPTLPLPFPAEAARPKNSEQSQAAEPTNPPTQAGSEPTTQEEPKDPKRNPTPFFPGNT